MIKEDNTIEIKQNQESVFAFLMDDSNLSLWVNGIVAVNPIGEHHNSVGDAVMIEVNVPKEMHIRSTLSRLDQPHLFATEYEAGNMKGGMQYTLKSVNESTTAVHYTAVHHPQGWLMKLLSPLIGVVIKKERKKELMRLKAVLESDTH
ncbi:SRPBCC family protein [Marinicella sp. W31]|uniref:SRPBCC family protein n=1 Tax=Marinicella sp. W31 TaxID=3023713 RepID=UPI003757FE3E